MGAIYKNGVSYGGGGNNTGTNDYTELTNKPQINGVTLNGNKTSTQLGVVSESNVTDEYDSTKSYVVDDVCIHSGVVYKCNNPTTGDWDSTKWDATTIAELIDEAKNSKWGTF